MTRLILMFMMIFTFSCGDVMTPEERGIEVSDRIGVFNQTKAMFWLQTLVEDEYDIDLGDLSTHGTVVYWADTVCPKNGQYAVIYEGKCNYGRMWSCDEMYVALSNLDPEKTCGSALLHEFGHCLSMMQGKGGDASHSDDRLWEVVAEANAFSCQKGW